MAGFLKRLQQRLETSLGNKEGQETPKYKEKAGQVEKPNFERLAKQKRAEAEKRKQEAREKRAKAWKSVTGWLSKGKGKAEDFVRTMPERSKFTVKESAAKVQDTWHNAREAATNKYEQTVDSAKIFAKDTIKNHLDGKRLKEYETAQNDMQALQKQLDSILEQMGQRKESMQQISGEFEGRVDAKLSVRKGKPRGSVFSLKSFREKFEHRNDVIQLNLSGQNREEAAA